MYLQVVRRICLGRCCASETYAPCGHCPTQQVICIHVLSQDFDYLRERCGHRYVKVKGDSCWDNKGRQLFLNDPTIEISISDYLDLIEVAEEHETCISWYMGKLPLHTDVPEMFEDIVNAPNSPWRKYGNCFGENNKGVHTYFGCGGNTTCIHSDPSENLLFVVTGEKFMDIYPPCDAACSSIGL